MSKIEEFQDIISKRAKILDGNIVKVDSFLNHMIDIDILKKVGEIFYDKFKDKKIDKILTAEVSGIAIAYEVARRFNKPLVFAKKIESKNLSTNVYEAPVYSYTKGKTYNIRVDKDYLKAGENIIIIDDFLARGEALKGLISLSKKAKANIEGIGVVIEKFFQDGGKTLRKEGFNIFSIIQIEKFENGNIVFRKEKDD